MRDDKFKFTVSKVERSNGKLTYEISYLDSKSGEELRLYLLNIASVRHFFTEVVVPFSRKLGMDRREYETSISIVLHTLSGVEINGSAQFILDKSTLQIMHYLSANKPDAASVHR